MIWYEEYHSYEVANEIYQRDLKRTEFFVSVQLEYVGFECHD